MASVGAEVAWAVPCVAGAVGEMIMKCPDGKYDGYVAEEATEGKLYRNVFVAGDLWFSTGDLLRFGKLLCMEASRYNSIFPTFSR